MRKFNYEYFFQFFKLVTSFYFFNLRIIFRKDMKKRRKVISSEMQLSPQDSKKKKKRRKVISSEMLLSQQESKKKKRRKVISSGMLLFPHDLNIGNEETTVKATVPGTLRTSGFVSLKENSSTVKGTTPDEAISTNGTLSMIKYNILQKYAFVETSNCIF